MEGIRFTATAIITEDGFVGFAEPPADTLPLPIDRYQIRLASPDVIMVRDGDSVELIAIPLQQSGGNNV